MAPFLECIHVRIYYTFVTSVNDASFHGSSPICDTTPSPRALWTAGDRMSLAAKLVEYGTLPSTGSALLTTEASWHQHSTQGIHFGWRCCSVLRVHHEAGGAGMLRQGWLIWEKGHSTGAQTPASPVPVRLWARTQSAFLSTQNDKRIPSWCS